MRWMRTLLIGLVLIAGCECGTGNLKQVCPEPVACWVESDVLNTESNLILEDIPREALRGACDSGLTACDEEGKIFCANITYPTGEVCDFEDNDCDGETDEGFDDDRDGVKTCEGDCNDQDERMFPGNEELCDGIDNDCNGIIPENEINDRDQDNVVECRDCNDRDPDVAPNRQEICDGVDNNCNGEIDENVIETWNYCGPPTNKGQCERDFNVCIDGELLCPGAVFPSNEACDAVDNDCDGFIDDSIVQPCETECGIGFETCRIGIWENCTAPLPSPEICDGFDNDCDGEVDEDCACVPGTLSLCANNVVDESGALLDCGIGMKQCNEDGEFGPCVFLSLQPEECNGHDDDCDGVVDTIERECGDRERAGIGQCKLGTEQCPNGEWLACEGAVFPEEERCDEVDNNCNGEVDENINSHEKVDIVFALDGSVSMCQFRDSLAQGIGAYVSDFEETDHKFSLVIFPRSTSFSNGWVPWVLATDLVDVNQFLAVLGSFNCNFPGDEPAYDVMYDLTDVENPVNISWRQDAYPYVILMTDELPQSWIALTPPEIVSNTGNCQVGECTSGDQYEVFVFTRPPFFPGWAEVTFNDSDRLIDINPPVSEEYVNKLKDVFTNVCL